MNKLNKLIAIVLSVALVAVNLPTDVFALRPAAYKNLCFVSESTDQRQQESEKGVTVDISKIKETAILTIQRAVKVLKPVLIAACFLPIALFINHLMCEYIINSSTAANPLIVLIDDPNLAEEAELFFEGFRDNFLSRVNIQPEVGITIPHLHYVSKEGTEIIFSSYLTPRLILTQIAVLCTYLGRLVKTRWFTSLAMIGAIYGISLNTFDVNKYHGVLNHLFITKMSLGDIFLLFPYAYLITAAIKSIIYIQNKRRILYKNKLYELPPDSEKTNFNKSPDSIASDLVPKNKSNANTVVDMSIQAEQIELPKTGLLSDDLCHEILAVGSAA